MREVGARAGVWTYTFTCKYVCATTATSMTVIAMVSTSWCAWEYRCRRIFFVYLGWHGDLDVELSVNVREDAHIGQLVLAVPLSSIRMSFPLDYVPARRGGGKGRLRWTRSQG